MGRQFGTQAELESIALELGTRPDVDNPYALANWVLRRKYASNPVAWSHSGLVGESDAVAYTFEHNGNPLTVIGPIPWEGESGWFWWELHLGNEPEPVMRWSTPHPHPDPALVVASTWVEQWIDLS